MAIPRYVYSYNVSTGFTGTALTGRSRAGKTALNFVIPKCIADGEYLFRIEHIGLHSAGSSGGAQLYISCAQLSITGGTATYKPDLMSFPGAYSASDPGLLINIYYPVPKSYTPPGGPALVC